jgi:hypothetical protein
MIGIALRAAPAPLWPLASLFSATMPLLGRWLFASVFLALIVWLVLIPAERIGHAKRLLPWWRNVRTWAIVVATLQALIYLLWR